MELISKQMEKPGKGCINSFFPPSSYSFKKENATNEKISAKASR